MAKAREQICTISHQDRQCRLHLDTLTQNWALSNEHWAWKGSHSTALGQFPATPLTVLGITGTSAHSDRIPVQPDKQIRQAHAKIPHAPEGLEHQI